MLEFFGVEVFVQGGGDVRLDNRGCQTLDWHSHARGLVPAQLLGQDYSTRLLVV